MLLKDLCARLPYGVKGKVETTDGNGKEIKDEGVINSVFINEHGAAYICIEGMEYELDDVKPYLRPMGSMTEEEKCQFRDFVDWDYDCNWKANTLEELLNGNRIISRYVFELFDWLNACHFDYRGLIPMGLALEAPEGMYIN